VPRNPRNPSLVTLITVNSSCFSPVYQEVSPCAPACRIATVACKAAAFPSEALSSNTSIFISIPEATLVQRKPRVVFSCAGRDRIAELPLGDLLSACAFLPERSDDGAGVVVLCQTPNGRDDDVTALTEDGCIPDALLFDFGFAERNVDVAVVRIANKTMSASLQLPVEFEEFLNLERGAARWQRARKTLQASDASHHRIRVYLFSAFCGAGIMLRSGT
jgi:hypothetical protein